MADMRTRRVTAIALAAFAGGFLAGRGFGDGLAEPADAAAPAGLVELPSTPGPGAGVALLPPVATPTPPAPVTPSAAPTEDPYAG